MRPIDGDSAVQQIKEFAECKPSCAEEFYEGQGCKNCAWGKIIEIVESAHTIEYGTWIPCSERLPKDAEEYHVTQYNKNAVTEYCDGYRTARIFFDDNGWWDDIDVLAGWEIIAWMPLPEPYREEKDDRD